MLLKLLFGFGVALSALGLLSFFVPIRRGATRSFTVHGVNVETRNEVRLSPAASIMFVACGAALMLAASADSSARNRRQ